MKDQVEQILFVLRGPKLGLGWIADEIVDSIHLGKPSEKSYTEPGQRRSKRGFYTQPFTPGEEMGVALRVLRSYFVDLKQVWEWSESRTPKLLDLPATPVPDSPDSDFSAADVLPTPVVIMAEQGQPLGPFDGRASELIHELSVLLGKAEKEEQTDTKE